MLFASGSCFFFVGQRLNPSANLGFRLAKMRVLIKKDHNSGYFYGCVAIGKGESNTDMEHSESILLIHQRIIRAVMAITRYEGQTFTKQVFQLEECWFINCVLHECTIFYGGGSYDLQNTVFNNCHWRFQGAANQTFQLLTQIGLLRVGQTPPPHINATSGSAMN